MRCEEGKKLHVKGTKITCVTECPENYTNKGLGDKILKEVYGDADICVHTDDVDQDNCPKGTYEFFNSDESGKSNEVKIRCA